MVARFCPACKRAVRAEDARCSSCDARLPPEDTIPSAFDTTPRPSLPDAAAGNLFLPLTMRDIDFKSLPQIDTRDAPIDLLIETDPPAVRPPTPERATIHQAKSERRAAVRRARMRQTSVPDCTDVLVLDPDGTTRSALCGLLLGFGFQFVVASNIEQASAIASRQHLAAAFLDISLDDPADNAGVALCRAIKVSRRSPGGAHAALVLVSARISPLDRIRAELVGCDAVIVKPARRGDVARALEACSVALPSDARRA